MSGQDQGYHFLPPREDVNSPDMYIPVMAFVTYILISTLLAGLRGQFHPEVMGSTFGYALAVVLVEIAILKLGTYILSITSESQLLDLVAYSGYKFVGVIVTLAVAEIVNLGQGTGGWAGWTVFTYTFLANAFFLVSDATNTDYGGANTSTAALVEIRSATGLFGTQWWRNDAYSCSVAAQSKDPVPFRIFLHGAIFLHVDFDATG